MLSFLIGYIKGGIVKFYFKYFGFVVILMVGFFYIGRAKIVIKNADEIMLKLQHQKEIYIKKPIEAITRENTIIPGIAGYEIDVDASYKKMKYIGEYNVNYLVYKKVMPSETLKNNRDKVIVSGNKLKKEVAVILVLNDKNDITLVGNQKEDITIFLNYSQSNRIIGEQFDEKGYCLLDNILYYSECRKYNKGIIYSKVIKNNCLKNTKMRLEGGALLTYEVNNSLFSELPIVIDFIHSRGYTIVKLDELLKE